MIYSCDVWNHRRTIRDLGSFHIVYKVETCRVFLVCWISHAEVSWWRWWASRFNQTSRFGPPRRCYNFLSVGGWWAVRASPNGQPSPASPPSQWSASSPNLSESGWAVVSGFASAQPSTVRVRRASPPAVLDSDKFGDQQTGGFIEPCTL